MLGSLGKFVRHTLGVLVAAIAGALLPLLGVDPTLFSPEQAATYSDALAAVETALYLFFTLLWYPLVEKWLKRFRWLDPEGYAGRLLTKQKATQLDPTYRP